MKAKLQRGLATLVVIAWVVMASGGPGADGHEAGERAAHGINAAKTGEVTK
jgi:hypothetical protein